MDNRTKFILFWIWWMNVMGMKILHWKWMQKEHWTKLDMKKMNQTLNMNVGSDLHRIGGDEMQVCILPAKRGYFYSLVAKKYIRRMSLTQLGLSIKLILFSLETKHSKMHLFSFAWSTDLNTSSFHLHSSGIMNLLVFSHALSQICIFSLLHSRRFVWAFRNPTCIISFWIRGDCVESFIYYYDQSSFSIIRYLY